MSHNIPDPSSLTVGDVTEASAANVEGYLRNASRKTRHFAAGEGGRGTKVNRGGAVTAADHNTLEAFKAAAANANPDGTFTVKREKGTAPAAAGEPARDERVKPETDTAAVERNDDDDVRVVAEAAAEAAAADDDDDDEDWAAVELGAEGDAAKAVKAEVAGAAVKTDIEQGEYDGVDVVGSRAPIGVDIGGGGQATAEGQPATLWELREQAKAQRWVEKNHLFAQCVTAFLLFVG
eukprot:CAMPEP_0174842668 /NCGR_PEP_ID=MMETSP1114-20130205/10054_1 /TAXON_ID=312471 /ORGANISM="Neobodo designis, Strain CCAP 1951/1" /LENGTH=235 /DNA_ID=CAMNT_0016076875 /DNA_START=16 /DNA_END=719 /DNA_ORIENTATION=-